MSKFNRNLRLRKSGDGTASQDGKSQVDLMLTLDDYGDDAGFGGVRGAQRHTYPFSHSQIETLPLARSADYGPAPGLNPQYGSRAMGDAGDMVSGSVAKARFQ
jgi:hypothetical protein